MRALVATLSCRVLFLTACGEPDPQRQYPRELCVERCIRRALDHLSDADHLQGIDAATFRAIEDSCRRHYACAPCGGDFWIEGDVGAWPCDDGEGMIAAGGEP